MQRATEQLHRARRRHRQPGAGNGATAGGPLSRATGDQGPTAAQASGDLESAMAGADPAQRAPIEANAKALESNDAIRRRAISLGA